MREWDLASLPGFSKETPASAGPSSRGVYNPIRQVLDCPGASVNFQPSELQPLIVVHCRSLGQAVPAKNILDVP